MEYAHSAGGSGSNELVRSAPSRLVRLMTLQYRFLRAGRHQSDTYTSQPKRPTDVPANVC
jgi:hypothetical protein